MENQLNEKFELWFAECIRLCALNNIGPDKYKWDLDDCDVWREKFQSNYSPAEAVESIFQSH